MTKQPIPWLISVGMCAVLPSPGFCQADADTATCGSCHARQADQLTQSVHASIQCKECHGGDASYALSAEGLAAYTESGAGTRPTFDHGAEFAGKASRREIPDRCGGCHADVMRMNAYGLRTDQLARYWTSGHGRTLVAKGDDRVAVCVDCHGSHDVVYSHEPHSRTHPLNIPGTCATCHSDARLMAEYDLPIEVVDEYRLSVHGQLLLEQHDTGAPSCATCHGNHSAMPPGFATVGAVCGKCHEHAAESFATSSHAGVEGFKGCVQCHGAGEDHHFHRIERVTAPPDAMIQRYARLLSSDPAPPPERITEEIHPEPKQLITQSLAACLDCHEEPEDDEDLPTLFDILETIAKAERRYVRTGLRLDQVGQGVLLVDRQRFLFQDAKTHLIGLSPVQHALDHDKVSAKVAELDTVCAQVDDELGESERGLHLRHAALIPIWAFAAVFAITLYAKYKYLKRVHVEPLP